jgi:hypothetical protein
MNHDAQLVCGRSASEDAAEVLNPIESCHCRRQD